MHVAPMRTLIGILAVALLLTACVPEPANRRASPQGATTPTDAAPSPSPTPAGPTPSPSFVRPTPTPQPTFLAYVVVARDTLGKIARRFGTSGRSIAYWNRAIYPSLDPDSAAYRPDRLTIGWTLLLSPGKEVDPEDLPPLPSSASAAPSATIEP